MEAYKAELLSGRRFKTERHFIPHLGKWEILECTGTKYNSRRRTERIVRMSNTLQCILDRPIRTGRHNLLKSSK